MEPFFDTLYLAAAAIPTRQAVDCRRQLIDKASEPQAFLSLGVNNCHSEQHAGVALGRLIEKRSDAVSHKK